MKLSLFTINFAATIFFMQCFLHDMCEAAVTCNLDGVCRDTRTNGEGTVCKGCKSCTFKNCCNKVYTSVHAKCTINGWKANGYKGNVPVDIGAPRKRDAGCSNANPCDKAKGYRCVAYKKGDDHGFCWREPQGEGGPSLFALAVGIAGLVILL